MTLSTYTRTGPFTDGGAPGISASFLNALEVFCAAGSFDSLVTADGSGKLTVVRVQLTTNSLKRIAKSTGSGNGAAQTITHNWGEQADVVLPYYNGNFGTAPTQDIAVLNEGSNSFQVVAQNGYSYSVCYIKF